MAQADRGTTSGTAAVSAQELRFGYGDIEAVKGISFEIAPGTVLSGNNGSWSIHGRLLPYLEQAGEVVGNGF